MSMVCGLKPLYSEQVVLLVNVISFSKEDNKETLFALFEALSCHFTVFKLVGPPVEIAIHALMGSVIVRICAINLAHCYHKLRPQEPPEENIAMEEMVQTPNQTSQQTPSTRFGLPTIIATVLVTYSITRAPVVIVRSLGFQSLSEMLANIYILFSTTLLSLIWIITEKAFIKFSFLSIGVVWEHFP